MPPFSDNYEIAIIGGGIAGAAVARDASSRGAKVVLLEKYTFGSGASSKSSKLIHGGIRYLELAWLDLRVGDLAAFWKNLRFVFLALRESRILRRQHPELVIPHPIWIPVYSTGKRSLPAVFTGCFIYGLFALFSGNFKTPSFFLRKSSVLKEIPNLNSDKLMGGVQIWDHLTDDKALVMRLIEMARADGAECREHAELLSYSFDRSRNLYMLNVKCLDGAQVLFAKKVVDAAGAWVDDIRSRGQEKDRNFIYPVAGAHIETKPFTAHSVLLEAKDGRLFFVINKNGLCRIGTTERVETNLDSVRATSEEINYLLESAKHYFGNTAPTVSDIVSSDAGIRPLACPLFSQEPNQVSREHEIRVGPTGVVHLIGVKLTDHRRAAAEVVDRLVPSLLAQNPAISRKSKIAKPK